MSPFVATVLLSAAASVGVALVVATFLQPAPSLERTLAHLRRPGAGAVNGSSSDRAASSAPSFAPSSTSSRVLGPVVRSVVARPRLFPSPADLRLVGRSVDEHAVRLVTAALVGGLVPPAALALAQSVGLVGVGVVLPAAASLVGAAVGPVLVHTATASQAERVRRDLRYQVSAYLDVVTMLLAGNTGYEGALEQAAHAGDGRLFVELRRRMRESAARGASLTDALARTGADLGLDELEHVAATAALSAAEGAPVARTLAAKCATLRSALSAEQESEARLRTSRLTTPIVGMALVFMALVMYPALTFS